MAYQHPVPSWFVFAFHCQRNWQTVFEFMQTNAGGYSFEGFASPATGIGICAGLASMAWATPAVSSRKSASYIGPD